MKIVHVTTREQLEACFGIRIQVFVEEQKVPVDLEMDEYDESPEACCHILVLDGEKPAAAGRWKDFGNGAAKLQRIAVLPEYRSRGVGRILVEGLEEWSKLKGKKSAVLDAQCSAEGFYRRLGYKTEPGEPFLDAGIPHVRMTRTF